MTNTQIILLQFFQTLQKINQSFSNHYSIKQLVISFLGQSPASFFGFELKIFKIISIDQIRQQLLFCETQQVKQVECHQEGLYQVIINRQGRGEKLIHRNFFQYSKGRKAYIKYCEIKMGFYSRIFKCILQQFIQDLNQIVLVMSSNLFENEFTKKPSREERKLQQAIRLIDKMEGNTQKPQNKKRNHTNTLLLNSQPKKKVKIEMLNYEPQSSSVNINQIQSSNPSSVVQQSSKPKKDKTVINQDYLNGQKQDLYSHLLQYELNEKQKYFEILHGDPLEIEKLPTAEGQFNFFSIDTVAKTNRAYQKIKERFQQGKNKLIRATSKEHKEFNSQFLKLDYLLN